MLNTNMEFDYHELPNAYLCDNKNSNEMRKQLISNQIKISECHQTDLENIFFSDENINIINKKLIYSLYYISDKKIKIVEQSKENLLIIMRYIFIEYAKHLPFNIKLQIEELNNQIIKELIPQLLTSITQRINYIKEINGERQINTLPINVNHKKTLPSITTVLM
jgi:hypothetical protein